MSSSLFRVDEPYLIERKNIRLSDFYKKRHLYVKRPPYQRKTVWLRPKQLKLIDSFFRKYYVPRIVLRQVNFAEGQFKYEVVDGQQRIESIQRFFSNNIPLPKSLRDITNEAGKRFVDLSNNVKDYLEDLELTADVIRMIEDPWNVNNQRFVTQVFWRLQQGESLSYMEVEHSKLSSALRNFVTKYADDISFDDLQYTHIDANPDRHSFFTLIERSNVRMEHLALLTRFLMIEKGEGPTGLSERFFSDFYDQYDGVKLLDFEDISWVKNCKKQLDLFYQVFKDDLIVKGKSTVKELRQEYFIISVYLLLRHLSKGNYTFTKSNYPDFHNFVYDFFQRWKYQKEDDTDIFIFRDNRQQDKESIVKRDQIIKQAFFEMNPHIKHTAPQRTFNEAQRIAIYRKDRGQCQQCLEEGRSPEDAFVPWDEFEADHIIPHCKGGDTTIENGQLLCSTHNRQLGAKTKS